MSTKDLHTASEVEAFNDIELYNELMARPYTQELKRNVVETIEGYGLEGTRVLEIGAGISQFSDLLKDHNYVVLTDLNRKLLSENPPRNIFAVCDAEVLPFKSKVFDFVYVIGVFHHLTDQSQSLREIERVMRDDGLMLTCEPHRMSLNFFYHTGRLLVMRLLGVDFVKRLIGCFSPDEAQVDIKAIKRVFKERFHVKIWTILAFRLPPFRLFKASDLDVKLSRVLDRIPLLNKLGTTVLVEIRGKVVPKLHIPDTSVP
jgi:ubiquinone/menaquinone biosynthesis C-methylase UbiE